MEARALHVPHGLLRRSGGTLEDPSGTAPESSEV